MKSGEKQMSNSFKKICASSVTIREFDEYDKCLKVLSGSCPLECDPQVPITEDDLNVIKWCGREICDANCYCRNLAAKYMFLEEKRKELFSPSKLHCVEYKCGHIRMLGDGNHRMCVLAHLGETISVTYHVYDAPCLDCKNKKSK